MQVRRARAESKLQQEEFPEDEESPSPSTFSSLNNSNLALEV